MQRAGGTAIVMRGKSPASAEGSQCRPGGVFSNIVLLITDETARVHSLPVYRP